MKSKIFLLLLITTSSFASHWECINRNGFPPTCNTWRWNVPGGWLVSTDNGDRHVAVVFLRDQEHMWKVD